MFRNSVIWSDNIWIKIFQKFPDLIQLYLNPNIWETPYLMRTYLNPNISEIPVLDATIFESEYFRNHRILCDHIWICVTGRRDSRKKQKENLVLICSFSDKKFYVWFVAFTLMTDLSLSWYLFLIDIFSFDMHFS